MTEYSEDALIEQSAIDVFKKDMRVEHMNCYEEKFPQTLGRETKADVILKSRLLSALDKLNDSLSEEEKNKVLAELLQDRNTLSLVKANQQVYKLLKDGIKIKTRNKQGEDRYKTVEVIDFKNPDKNDFFLVSQFWITGEVYTRRPDLVLFVNGIPLVVVEFKARGFDVMRAYEDNITDYKDTIPHLFWYNAFLIISNGRESKIGTITSGYEHFSEWKKISSENEVGVVSLDTILKGTCEKARFLDLLENFILFTTLEGHQVKILAKNHQFLGTNNAIHSFENRKTNKGRLGVFWHTQGAGKSYSMIFLAQKILRRFKGNFTFVVVTDRLELDEQIYKNFQNSGVVTEVEVQAVSGPHLKILLKEDHRLLFTIIHKFNTRKGEVYPMISDRDDIIVITDEAHRTQYDTLALNMRNALPNACFIGFTGTPLLAGEEKTRETFGDYVSIYNFRASIDDNATVPLYYENRVPELQLTNPTFNEDIYDIIEEAELDTEQEDKLSREFQKEYHILTRDDRLNTIAEDIVNHFVRRGYQGKAMVVAIDKFTTVRMFDKVQYYWPIYIEKLKSEANEIQIEKEKLRMQDRVAKLEKLDMAVVISQEQNEVKKFREKGLEISKHRKRMAKEDLATLFKDANSDFQIVFVCNMWMTGFDVPSLSSIYLDKPMRNHTLMQTIARANRVFKDKSAGFIVDYVNIFRNLKKALAMYAAPSSKGIIDMPIDSKEELVKELRRYISELAVFLNQNGVDQDSIISSRGLQKNSLLDAAVSSLVAKEQIKKTFLAQAGNVWKVYRAILPHPKASEFNPVATLYQDLMKEIRSLDPEIDITGVMNNIERVLDKSVISRDYVIHERQNPVINLGTINFEALRKRLEKNRSNADIELLKNILSFKLKEIVRLNITRMDYLESFQKLVDEYNAGSVNQETFFGELIRFSTDLEEEDKRKVTEGLSEEELSLFDKLKKPHLTEKDKNDIKKVAKELLTKLQAGKLVLDWRKKQQARAAVRLEIEKELDTGLPQSYSMQEYGEKCELIFQHFYDNYFGDGKSLFNQSSRNKPEAA